ncbi:trimeric intracellular cation channel family protein [Rhodohalobacter sp. 8-1]|uniref:trimeric intracellular cation channel family protein n=1 Tax=Rhodohalobacter sp. 8-1 TaxID=3131972 RepID=UPI0030EC4F49
MIDFDLLTTIDALGTFAFAVSGATAAIRSRYDIFGILVLAFVTAISGGTLRDLLIGNTPVNWLTDTITIWSALTGFGFALIFYRRITKWEGWLFYFDAVGLGLFTVTGTQIALNSGMSVGISVALGTVTGCFGGVIRDVLAAIKPLIFRKEIYASAAVLGGVVFAATQFLSGSLVTAQLAGILSTPLFRIIAVRFHLELPKLYSSTN